MGKSWLVAAAALTTVPLGPRCVRIQSRAVAQSASILLSPALTGNDSVTSIESCPPRNSLTVPSGDTPVVMTTLPPSGV